MTSKEALEAVKRHLIEAVWKPIEKDLEVLDKLKECYHLAYLYKESVIYSKIMFILKEWFENEHKD